MRRSALFAVLALILITGCSSSGAFIALNQTQVSLQEGNYVLAARDVSGQASAGYLIGVSYSTGVTAQTLALARVEGTGQLYAEALQNLWDAYEKEHGEVEDSKLALANVRYDADILNLILYTKVTITVRADIVRFL